MFYKNIYIRDFGILNNQHLNNIANNLVVIGGKNRAGKSTFLKLLRHLPYGLPQDNSIPPANNQYYIEAELENYNSNYNLYLKGYAAPEIIDQNKNKIEITELFNHLDQFSYQQLFTITLDELQNLSKIAKGKKKEKQLFSILLGAGLSELVKVPGLADKYHNYAKNIGGLLGDPSVASFKPYYNEIKEAEELRDQALLEIKEFNRKKEKLKKSEESLKELERKIKADENNFFILDLLKNNYSALSKIENLKMEIKQSPMNLKDLNKINFDRVSDYKQKINLLKEKIKNYKTKSKNIEAEYQSLINELETLNSNLDEPLVFLDKIRLDLLDEKKLNYNLNLKQELETAKKNIADQIDKINFEIEEAKSDFNSLEYKEPSSILKKTYSILTFAVIILSSSFFINYSQLKYFSLIVAFTALIYYSSNYKSSKLEKENFDQLRQNIEQKENELNLLKKKIASKDEDLKKVIADLNHFRQKLAIKNNSSDQNFSFLNSYFLEIKEKKRRYNRLKVEEDENEKMKTEILFDLNEIYDLIKMAAELSKDRFNLKLDDSDNLIKNAELLFQDLKLLADLKTLAAEYENKKNQINYLLIASDKTKKTLNDLYSNQEYLPSFLNLFQSFSSLSAVEKKKNNYDQSLKTKENKKQELEEDITTLKNEINALSSSKKIEVAQKKINKAQNNLEKQAQRYAVNKSVYFILKKLRKRMVEKAEKELLEPASDLLAKISDNYYKKLETAADLESSDFKTITAAGEEFNSVDQLSRGSIEQLFLAVRISRIREIKPHLPIILDDSLVNFDHKHLYNTAEIISKLAQNHQIFILSCHPHLINFISEISKNAQYWKLDEGKFELSNSKKLTDYLTYQQ